MRRWLILIILMLLMPIVSATDYKSVYASNTNRSANNTEISTLSTIYVPMLNMTPPENVQGTARICFEMNETDPGFDNAYAKIYKNNQSMGTEQSTSEVSWVQKCQNLSITLNTTDVLSVWGRTDYGAANTNVRNFSLNYDWYPEAPTNLMFRYNATGVNITWSQASNASGYNISYNRLTKNKREWAVWSNHTYNYSFVPLNASEGIEVSIFSFSGIVLNTTSLSGSDVFPYSHTTGGVLYNWSSNSTINWTLDNMFANYGDNFVEWALWAHDFDNNQMPNWTAGSGVGQSWFVANGRLQQTNATATDGHYHFNMSNLSNFDVKMALNSSTSGGLLGMDFREAAWGASGSRYGYEYWTRASDGLTRIMLDNGGSTVLNSTTQPFTITNDWIIRMRANGSSLNGKLWLSSATEHSVWNSTVTNATHIQGRLGIITHQGAMSVDWIWARPVKSDGSLNTTGNMTTTVDATTLSNANAYSVHKGLRFNLTGNNISVYIQSSPNGSIFTEETLLSSTVNNDDYIVIPTAHRQRYLKVRINVNTALNTETNFRKVKEVIFYIQANASVHGQITDGVIPINGATILFQNGTNTYISTTTDSNGNYQLFNVPLRNVTLVVGKTSYKPNGTWLLDVNGSWNETRNFVLSDSPVVASNIFLSRADSMFQEFRDNFDEFGHLYSTDGYNSGNYGSTQTPMTFGAVGGILYNTSYNESVYSYEAALRILGYNTYLMEQKIYDENNINYSKYGDNLPDINSYYYTHNVYYLKPYLDTEIWSRINATFSNFDSEEYSIISWSPDVDSNCLNDFNYYENNRDCTTDAGKPDGLEGNWAYFTIISELHKKAMGAKYNATAIYNLESKIVKQTNLNGSIQASELMPSTSYQTSMPKMGYEAIGLGETNSSFINATNIQANWAWSMVMQGGEVVPAGRNVGTSNYHLLLAELAFIESTPNGSHYRLADKSMQKLEQYKITDTTYYETKNFLENGAGLPSYAAYIMSNSVIAWEYAHAGEVWDSSVVELLDTYGNVDDFNGSGVLTLNNGNYSISTFSRLFTKRDFNGSQLYPFRFLLSTKDNSNFSIFPNIDTSTSGIDEYKNFFMLNSDDYLNLGSLVPTNNTRNDLNKTYYLGSNSMWVNFTNFTYNTGVTNNTLAYYNISATVNGNNINMSYELGYNSTNYSINSYNTSIDFIGDDGRSQANYIISGTDINYSRGNENVTVRNITSGFLLNKVNAVSFTSFGQQDKIWLNKSVSSSPIKLSYDVTLTTNNTYEYWLNQPPGVLDYSPSSPYNTTTAQTTTFSVSFTQTLQYINWTINGTLVQSNVSVNSAIYTNTSAGVGNYTVNATGSNAQGTATQTWKWNVTQAPTLTQGYIYSIGSTPVSGVNINVSNTNGQYLSTIATTNDSGYWNMSNLDGTYYIFATWTNESSAKSSNFTVNETQSAWVNLTLIPSYAVTVGQVVSVNLSNSSDFDSGETLRYSVNRTDLFPDFNIVVGTGTWPTTGSAAGNYYVKFGVTDGYLTTNKTYLFTLTGGATTYGDDVEWIMIE